MTALPLAKRQELVGRLPWVTRLEASPGRCEAYKYGHMPLKAVFRVGSRPPVPGLKEKYRCKNAAWWRFRPLRRSAARPGDYCWSHLMAHGLYGNEMERDRTNRKILQLILADDGAALREELADGGV